jgi:hypothetical protein
VSGGFGRRTQRSGRRTTRPIFRPWPRIELKALELVVTEVTAAQPQRVAGQDAALRGGVEFVLYKLRQVGSSGRPGFWRSVDETSCQEAARHGRQVLAGTSRPGLQTDRRIAAAGRRWTTETSSANGKTADGRQRERAKSPESCLHQGGKSPDNPNQVGSIRPMPIMCRAVMLGEKK